MKKIGRILSTLILCSAMFTSQVLAAPTVSLSKAELAEGVITVEGRLTDMVDNQSITVMVTKIVDGKADYSAIEYLNIFEDALNSDGSFSISFKETTLNLDEGIYIARVGGKDVEEPCDILLVSGTNGEITILWGDVNEDGIVSAADSALTLQYVLGTIGAAIGENGLKAADVLGTGNIVANNAAAILQKTLNTEMKFPVEN